jgi:hypothetical protein
VRRTTLIALTAFLVGSASAQPKIIPRAEDHLEPETSVLGGNTNNTQFDVTLREALDEIFASDIAIRMIGMPAFGPEYAIGLRKTAPVNGTMHRISTLTLSKGHGIIEPLTVDKRGQLRPPPLPWKRNIKRCEVPIRDELGNRITEVWRKMLMRTRYSAQYTGGADGATFVFSMYVAGLGDVSGKVWIPERNSSTGTLVALANAMYDVCNKEKGASMDQVEKLTTELEHRLK